MFPNMNYRHTIQPFHAPDYVPEFTPASVGYEPGGYMASKSSLLTFPQEAPQSQQQYSAPRPNDYYAWRPPGWSQIVDAGESAEDFARRKAREARERAEREAREAREFAERQASGLLPKVPDIGGFFNNLLLPFTNIAAETGKTMQFMMYLPMILGGALVLGLFAIIATIMLRKKPAPSEPAKEV